jgi:hypothetical protein
MLGYLITVKKTEENGGDIVAKFTDLNFTFRLNDLEKQGIAQCIHDGGGYPNIYHAKSVDLLPIIEKKLSSRSDVEKRGSFMMMGYGIVSDLPVVTTKDISDIPFCSPDETLIIEQWDLS